MTARSPKNKFSAQVTFSNPLQGIGSQITVGGLTIDDAKAAAKFYTSQDKGMTHVVIQENIKDYPEFEWVNVESYDE